MKGHKSNGGGVNEAAEDLNRVPEKRNNAKKIFAAAEERKRGGRAKKSVGDVMGEMARRNAGRKPRKSGGSVESSPFSHARKGTAPKGHKTETAAE